MSSTSAESLLATALESDTISQLNDALEQVVKSGSIVAYHDFVNSALRSAVQSGCISITTYLLTEEEASTSTLTPIDICAKPSIQFFELLLAHGWDLNQAGPQNSIHKGRRIIDWVCGDDALVEWLVKHKARVDGGEMEYAVEARPPLLLETCAALGSVKTFKLLQSHGARLGRRTLHVAVGQAAARGIDPANFDGPEDERDVASEDASRRDAVNRAEMLIFLVEQLNLDVNAMDSDVARSKHWGTPLKYAAAEGERGAAVVKWLLSRGADPQLRSTGEARAAEHGEINQGNGSHF